MKSIQRQPAGARNRDGRHLTGAGQTLAKNRALSLNALAERTQTHQSTVSVVVKRLVAERLVHSRPSPRDGRRVELELTPSGRALLSRAPVVAQDRLIVGVQALSARERAALAAILAKLATGMRS